MQPRRGRGPKSPFSYREYLSTPKDDATAYTWDVLLTKRSSAGDAVLSGAVLGVTDPQGRHLAQDGSWHKSSQTVTTNSKGQVRLSGVDSGTYHVSEARAPEGYQRFEGTRKLVLAVTGLDVRQVASAHPTLTIQAESPLRADAVESSTSLAQAQHPHDHRPAHEQGRQRDRQDGRPYQPCAGRSAGTRGSRIGGDRPKGAQEGREERALGPRPPRGFGKAHRSQFGNHADASADRKE